MIATRYFVRGLNKRARTQISAILGGRKPKMETCSIPSKKIPGKSLARKLLVFELKRDEVKNVSHILQCEFFYTSLPQKVIIVRDLDFGQARMEIFRFLKKKGASSPHEISCKLRLDPRLVEAVLAHMRENNWLT